MEDFDRRFVSLASPTAGRNGAGYLPCQGLYFTPKGSSPRTALIATHYNVDFSEHYLGEFLARRGYGFLGWNTRYRGNEAFFMLEQALVDIGAGVRWLREAGGRRADRAARELRRRLTYGGLPVPGRRA